MSEPREKKDRTPAPASHSGEDTARERASSQVDSSTPGEGWSRRRFGKTALGVTPVIATLYGRPLSAAANCTPSGWVSGNTSNHHELEDCGGYTPGYWQSKNSKGQYRGWGNIHDELLDSSYGFPELSFFVGGAPATMQHAVEGPGKTPFDSTDMLTRQVMRFGTAALLNARYVIGYSLTETEVTEIVAMTVLHGGYTSPAGDYLDALQVKAFLENTMAAPSWGG